MQPVNMPIGYWIKRADEVLTKEINEIHAQFELNRTGWQILNTIYEKVQINKTETANLLKPFADEQTVIDVITRFKDNGIVTEVSDQLSLTQKGTQLHTACFEKQQAFRQQMMNGISDQEYQQTVYTLRKIIENLSL